MARYVLGDPYVTDRPPDHFRGARTGLELSACCEKRGPISAVRCGRGVLWGYPLFNVHGVW